MKIIFLSRLSGNPGNVEDLGMILGMLPGLNNIQFDRMGKHDL